MSFVGIDVGGSFLKAAVLDDDGSIGSVVRRPVPDFVDVDGDAREIDPDALIVAVRSLVAETAHSAARVDGVLVTGQMAGIAFVDEQGSAVAPLVSWQDTRVSDVDAVATALGLAAVEDLGDGLRAGLPLVQLHGLGIPAGSHVTSLIAFVAGALCERYANVVHATDAAAWGLYDVRHRRWSTPALNLLGLSDGWLPRVSWSVAPVGRDSRYDAPVYCAVGDHQAALLGAGLDANSVSVNLATGCQVSVRTAVPESPAQLRPYLDGGYLQTVTHLPAGRLLAAAVREHRGSAEPADWAWAASSITASPRIASAVDAIAEGIVTAVERLGARSRPVLFSGGLAQRFTPIRERLIALLGVPARTYPGDDAALAGLGALAAAIATTRTPTAGLGR